MKKDADKLDNTAQIGRESRILTYDSENMELGSVLMIHASWICLCACFRIGDSLHLWQFEGSHILSLLVMASARIILVENIKEYR